MASSESRRRVPLASAIELLTDFGETVCWNKLTGQVHRLDGIGWSATFGDDGFGVVRKAGEQERVIDDIFSHRFWKTVDGKYIIELDTGEFKDYIEHLQDHQPSWPKLDGLHDMAAKVYIFKCSRQGASIYWEFRLWQQHVVAGVSAGELAHHAHAKWPEWVEQSGDSDVPRVHWRRAKPTGQGRSSQSAEASWDNMLGFRVLREASMSSWALVWWLAFLAARSYRGTKQQAFFALQALINMAMAGSFDMEMSISTDPQEFYDQREKEKDTGIHFEKFLRDHPASKGSASSRGPGKRKAGVGSRSPWPDLPPTFIPASDIQKYLPPAYKFYNDSVNKRCQAFHPKMGTRSRAWSLYSYDVAACLCIDACWKHAFKCAFVDQQPYEKELAKRAAT